MKKTVILFLLPLFIMLAGQKTHTVAEKETAYSISKKYGLSLDELYALNPKIKNATLTVGEKLTVEKPAVANISSEKYGTIVLKPKQTIYGITKQYHISEADLRKLNPNLDQNMKIGDKVKLPLDLIKKYEDNGAQNENSNLNASENDVYIIQKGDTYYSLTRKFNISQAELFKLNPSLEEKGLIAGNTLVLKKNTYVNNGLILESQTIIQEPDPQTAQKDDGDTYTVKAGDTMFSISQKFGMTINELIALNPNIATDGLKAGSVLKIKTPAKDYVKKTYGALNVALLLPFGFDEDGGYRTLASDFFSGAKLALENQTENGKKLNVNIIDSGSENGFSKVLTKLDLDNTDLIIGPFFKSNLVEVLNYVRKQNIPVVAPFANSADLFKYDNLVIMEPDSKVFADRIAEETINVFENQKIYILADADKTQANYLQTKLKGRLKNADIKTVSMASEIFADKNMMTGQSAPVIAILASETDSQAKTFTEKMLELSAETQGNKAFSVFYNPVFDKNSDALAKVNLVYIIDRKIDTEGSFEKKILEQYHEKYCTAPPKYAVIGFDVVNDMISRENAKGELFKQMNREQTQLATKFVFDRSNGKSGAFINKGYRVVRLLSDEK